MLFVYLFFNWIFWLDDRKISEVDEEINFKSDEKNEMIFFVVESKAKQKEKPCATLNTIVLALRFGRHQFFRLVGV